VALLNDLQTYLGTVGGLAEWSPVVMPGVDDPPTWGVEIGLGGARTSAVEYVPSVLRPVLSTLPPAVRDGISSAVVEVMGSIMGGGGMAGAGAAIAGVSQAFSAIAPLVAGMTDAMEAWAGFVEGIRTDNDSARADARGDYWRTLQEMKPSTWVRAPWAHWTYTRKLGFNRYRHPSIYPVADGDATTNPDFFGPFGLGPAPENPGSGCAGGDSDFSGGYGNCNGSFRTYPLFFPIWHDDCFGWNKSDRGMERASAGAATQPASSMLAMQGALLSQPIPNLTADGEMVLRLWRHFRDYFSNAMSRNSAWGKGAIDWVSGAQDVEIDPKFNPDVGLPSPDGRKNRFYFTPSGLIGQYVNGEGTLLGADLKNVGPSRWASNEYNPAGGNFLSFANWNTVNTVVASFFSYRAALLRRRSFMESIVNDYPELLQKQHKPTTEEDGIDGQGYYPIPEAKLRAAIVDAATITKVQAGAAGGLAAPKPPSPGAAGVAGGFAPGKDPKPPRQKPQTPTITMPIAPEKTTLPWIVPAAIGAAVIGGGVAGGVALARKLKPKR